MSKTFYEQKNFLVVEHLPNLAATAESRKLTLANEFVACDKLAVFLIRIHFLNIQAKPSPDCKAAKRSGAVYCGRMEANAGSLESRFCNKIFCRARFARLGNFQLRERNSLQKKQKIMDLIPIRRIRLRFRFLCLTLGARLLKRKNMGGNRKLFYLRRWLLNAV